MTVTALWPRISIFKRGGAVQDVELELPCRNRSDSILTVSQLLKKRQNAALAF